MVSLVTGRQLAQPHKSGSAPTNLTFDDKKYGCEANFFMHLSRLWICEGRSVVRFGLTKKVICNQAFLSAKSQHLVAGYQGKMGQSTHHRLDRLQIVSVQSLRDQSTTQILRWSRMDKLIGFQEESVKPAKQSHVMLVGIVRGHQCVGPPYLHMRAPEWHSGENLADFRQFFQRPRKQQERILWRGIVDIKTIQFVFLLILPR